ncbi:MAG TPA: MauE/DoxX family redox-associated membrane protein [Sphingomonas sp.]
MPDPIILFATSVRLCLGLLFVASGTSKLLRQSSIRHVIAQYRLLPPDGVAPAALGLATGEVLAGLLLMLSFLPALSVPAIVSAATLLCLFSAAIASALLRGIVVPCGCSLILNGHVVTWATFARNQALLALLLADRLTQPGALS